MDVQAGQEARYGHRYGILELFSDLIMCMSSKDWLVKVFAAEFTETLIVYCQKSDPFAKH